MNATKQQARHAGLLYFVMGLIAPIGLMYVPGKLIVTGDATATADRIRAAEGLLRLGIATNLIHQTIGIFLVLALYRLFKDVDQKLAVTMVILGTLLSLPIAFMNEVNWAAALILAKGAPYLSVFEPRQLDALAYLFLRLHTKGIAIASIFWGLWLFPFGLLVMRSGFIPRVLGVLMMIAGVGYLAESAASLVLPQYAHFADQYALIMEVGELPIIFWLLIWGAKEPRLKSA